MINPKPDQNFNYQFLRLKIVLFLGILITLIFFLFVYQIRQNNFITYATQYSSSMEDNYKLLIENYIRIFDTAYAQIIDKIETEDPSFEDLEKWLRSKDKKFQLAMGKDIYDGISFTYKGGFERSWTYGDYSNYDPTVRDWYKTAEAAGGKTVVTAPYVTFLDSQFSGDGSYITITVVKKYNNEIYFDYDIKLYEIKALLSNSNSLYPKTELYLCDQNGIILSSSDEKKYAHNIFEQSDQISESFISSMKSAMNRPNKITPKFIDGHLYFIFLNFATNGNISIFKVPFESIFIHDLLAITLIGLIVIFAEIFFYKRDKFYLIEVKSRDYRLSQITDAVFQEKIYVDLKTMQFSGNKKAVSLCSDRKYEHIYSLLKDKIIENSEIQIYEDFLSPEALIKSSENKNMLFSRKFLFNWDQPDGSQKPATIEVSRLATIIDGKSSVAILCRDVSEDAEILKTALKQAESASHAKGDFMSRMSHEIRTPLNAIIGYIDIAKDEKENLGKVEHCLNQCTVASKHLLSIINDVLDISSIESGRMKISNDDFDLSKLIYSLTTIFYAQANAKGVKFFAHVDNLTDEWVRGDSLRVNQILLNLLSNAVKFTPSGGFINLYIKQIGTHEGKNHFQFKVQDSGCGMSEEYRSRIFKPFEQENATIARKYGGTGLGLSISHNLVKMMGGTIDVESEVGKGTVFTLTLAFDKSEVKVHQDISTQSFSKLYALVVDDDLSACEYTQKLLDRCGIKNDVVNSGKKALRRIENRLENGRMYDFCIIDWNMEEMDGLETSKKIRELVNKDIPIIIATGYDYSSIVDQARLIGIDKIISKPLFQSTLFDLLVNTYGKYSPIAQKKNESVNFNGLKVLLAEDNEMNMEIALDILKKAGLVITPVVNGKEALETFTASEPGTFDAILMDVQMPIMDGYEATRAIRKSSHKQAKDIPIIAMTANAFTSDITAALSAGMNDHVAKPINYKVLFDSLSHLIKNKEAQ